ncbi:hypothetical protein GCM10007874_00230 [Labrys miyagiensis]|uniref:Serine protease n=2 Tax=Labrys miyagiensis TaxID=346912 RepID=A0ABQ6C9Q9_9HYPH|nr:hypothetical protein GCM10007874_00230 [Labrys miyagiensis]
MLDLVIPAIGRVDLTGAPLSWVGTGWLVADNIIVTNRHVAQEFAERKGDEFTFKMGAGGQISASVDFLQEIDNWKQLIFKLIKPLYIEQAPDIDVAFFEIEKVSGNDKLAKPIDLAAQIAVTENIVTIGYPAYDSRIPEPDLMERIYGKIYNKKRLAPGGVTKVEPTRLWHNCTTLGGNSGSVVYDLHRGEALGLHFSGSFLKTNYAVRADVVRGLLDRVRQGRASNRAETRTPQTKLPEPPEMLATRSSVTGVVRQPGRHGVSLTIPLKVNVSIEIDPAWIANQRPPQRQAFAGGDDTEDYIDENEGVAEDYRDRVGYDPAFLGAEFEVTLPVVQRNAEDVLEFDVGGNKQSELRYEHYSVVMSRGRRMCFLSACNIDGNQSRKSARVAWKWDPRIPRSQQIMKECYGSPPKFSRGHMTRREDPGWGTPDIAKLGNEDSMHVTNTTPQMQAFNAPIWLALEDYALQHAKEDAMKISVFTGPYFSEKDPTMYGVRIPLAFWKVIAFIHDETQQLCATGYEMNQEQNLQPEEEFVFGAFTSPQLNMATQVSIRSIEARSGVDFGRLVDVDPLASSYESVEGSPTRGALLTLEQIQFVR